MHCWERGFQIILQVRSMILTYFRVGDNQTGFVKRGNQKNEKAVHWGQIALDHGIWGSHFEKQNPGHLHLKMITSCSLITW